MEVPNEHKRIQREVYAITGHHVPEDDVIILAALFYSQKLQNAAQHAADQIDAARARSEAVLREAATLASKAAGSNKALADAFEVRLQKAFRQVAKSHSDQAGPPHGWPGVFAGVALGIFIAAGTMLVACNFRVSWFADARLGAELHRVLPSFDPAFREAFLEQFEKHRR